MVNFLDYALDLDTERPNPDNPLEVRKGESPRTAFTKLNHMLAALNTTVTQVSPNEPENPVAYQEWIDTGSNPVMIKRRNAVNSAWVNDGVAFNGDSLFTTLKLDSSPENKQEARQVLELGSLATLTSAVTNTVKAAAREILQLEYVGNTAPTNPIAYMVWIDTSVEPEIMKRRSRDNLTWVEIGPVFP